MRTDLGRLARRLASILCGVLFLAMESPAQAGDLCYQCSQGLCGQSASPDQPAPDPGAMDPSAMDPSPLAPDTAQPDLPLEQFAALGSDSFALADIGTAYIDFARPMNVFRFRFDAAYGNNRPNRAEFFYARGAPLGPGVPIVETNIDYQDYVMYVERAWTPRFSTFAEGGAHAINPTQNNNTTDAGDANFGFKRAMVLQEDVILTFQFKTYVPTGDSRRGLGNNHPTVEPGLLGWFRMTDRWNLSTEFRCWVPIEGTPGFAGEVLRYGLGTSYRIWDAPDGRYVMPVFEVVGWSVLDGLKTVASSPTVFTNVSAAGDTIVNLKPGVRFGLGRNMDAYLGYGFAVTGEVWYREVIRAELRRMF